MIGEFEEKLLMAILKNDNESYGAEIFRTLEAWGRSVNIGAIYLTISRLEKKGFVETWEGEPEASRGGRRKRLCKVTGSGIEAVNEARLARLRIESSSNWQLDHGLEG